MPTVPSKSSELLRPAAAGAAAAAVPPSIEPSASELPMPVNPLMPEPSKAD